jgi:hypothetical protein
MEEEDQEPKRTSKLTALIGSEADDFNGLQVTVYYSENNWETCEEISLILDEKTTINQLIDAAIYKFKTELFYDNIDKKQFNVMLFKKKKRIPNDEYPICNLESQVKTFGKAHFCLVEDKSATTADREPEKEPDKEKKKKEKEKEKANNDINIDNVDINNNDINNNINKDINKNEKKENQDKKVSETEENKETKGYKTCGGKCLSCLIF